MAKRVVDKAATACSYGTAPSVLLVPDNHHRITNHKNVANISDHISIKNVAPFGKCKSMSNPAVAAAAGTPQTCIPITPLKWQQNNKAIILDKEKILDDRCVCACIWKGIIAITDAGQDSHFIENDTPGSPSEEDKKQASEAMEKYRASDEGKKTVAAAEEKTLKDTPELEGAEHISQVEYQPGNPPERLHHQAGAKYDLSESANETFSGTPKDKTLKPGTKIYRIIDDKAKPNGRYWSRDLPSSRSEWRSKYAVKNVWNKNGKYAEYTVKKELPIWEGKAATQDLNEEGFSGWVQKGGGIQLFIPTSEQDIALEDLTIKPTNWEE